MVLKRVALALFVSFRLITLKQLNSLTTLKCLGGLDVTHKTVVSEVPGSIPDSGK